jgi:hypothetical protein
MGEPGVRMHDRLDNVASFVISGTPYRIAERRRGVLAYPFEWSTERLEP